MHHDNAASHTALVLRDHFVKNCTHIVPQPPYLPDLAAFGFWLVPKLKRPLRGMRFESIDKTKTELKKALMAIPEKHYLQVSRIGKYVCISLRGDYFEGAKIGLQE